MSDLEAEAKKHFEKLEQSIKYHEGRLNTVPEKVRPVVFREISALKFVMEQARKALAEQGVTV